MPRRDIGKMFAPATAAAEKSGEIARLKAELEALRIQSGQADFKEIPINEITSLRLPDDMGQPRKYFDPIKLERLKASIEKHGVLEPILVRHATDGLYETVSGERRWRCCRDLGRPTILASIKSLNDEDALEVALIATIHSEGVSTIEETDSVLSLMKLYLGIKGDQDNKQIKRLLERAKNFRQSGLADIEEQTVELVEATLNSFGFNLGSFVSNRMPLIDMAAPILEAVRAGKLSPTNALLINRTDSKHHAHLIDLGMDTTKQELRQKISEIKSSTYNSGIIEPTLREKVHKRYQAVRRKAVWKKIDGNPDLKSKMEQVEALLEEILGETIT
ncbi:MAG: ParB/RepB/Spo0J family partition protein [Leptolyngbyaceae cyanobacterium]